VSLSTTLCDNSVVEGKGSRVGLIIAVPDENSFKLPANIRRGSCRHTWRAQPRGEQTAPLDIDAAHKAIRRMKGSVDAIRGIGIFQHLTMLRTNCN